MSMLSKEEKLRYGEMLRQQMKQKEDRKKQEDYSKRGGQPYIPKTQSDRVLVQQPIFLQDPKEVLQKKLETQDYNPFGKAGGGAPNRRQQQNVTGNGEMSSPSLKQPTQQQTYYYRNYPQYPNGTNNGQYAQPSDVSLRQQQISQQQQFSQQQQQFAQQQQQSYAPQEYQRPINDYAPPRQYYQQPPPAISPQTIHRNYQQPPQNPYPEPIQRSYHQIPNEIQQSYQQPAPRQYYPDQMNPRQYHVGDVIQRSKTLQNEQMQQMYKRGGRNLLKLQNQTVNEHLVKQKQKLQMQAFLKQQMEEVERRKQEEKDRLKREELQEQKRNRDYIDAQNQKLKDEERRKNDQRQRIIDENVRNLAMRKDLEQEAKDKLERERLEGEKRRDNHEKERQRLEAKRDQILQQKPERLPVKDDDTSSLSSSSTEQVTHGKGFNTEISRQFFRKEREKQKQPAKYRNDKKLQIFTSQIQKMRDQINNQGDLFQKQIERIKRENEANLHDKRKAELEIQKLRIQLERKNKESEIRLYEALKRNDPNYYQQPQQQYPYRPPQPYREEHPPYEEDYRPQKMMQPTPPKPMAKKKRVEQYEANQNQSFGIKPSNKHLNSVEPQYQPRRRLQDSEVMTLDADSKKIPISIPSNTKLTMSKIQNYGKDSSFYQQPAKNNYRQRENPIPEEQQERVASRKSQRHPDQLDRFVQSRGNKQWEMSTVKDDITKEIEELLKKKDSKPYQGNQRQGSQMSQAGRQILSRGALPYDGPNINSLNSNKASLVSNGTMDVDRIYERNQNRLRQLRALGVETINTTNDQDLNRLNTLLRDYR